MSFAHHLGFNPIGVVPVMTSGVGDAGVPMYYWSITIDIGPTQIDAVAGFTEGMNSKGCGLLGQFGFFDRFKVHFDLPNGLFWIDIPDPPQINLPPTQSPAS